jgi:WD40 repeat protein
MFQPPIALSLAVGIAIGCSSVSNLTTYPVARRSAGVAFVPQIVASTSTWSRAAVSPDGKLALLADQNGSILVLDLVGGKILRSLHPHGESVIALVVTPDGRTARSASRDGSVCLIDLAEIEVVRCRRGRAADFHVGAFTLDGSLLATGSRNPGAFFDRTRLAVWATDGGRRMTAASAHEHAITAVAWSEDGRWLASTGGGANGVRLTDARTGAHRRTLATRRAPTAIAFTRTGLVVAAIDGALHAWDPVSGQQLAHVARDVIAGGSRAAHPRISELLSLRDAVIAIRIDQGTCVLVDLASRARLHHIDLGQTSALAIAASRDGDHVLVVTGTHEISLIDVAARRATRTHRLVRSSALTAVITPADRVLVGGQDHVLRFDLATGAVAVLPGRGAFRTISSNGRFAIATTPRTDAGTAYAEHARLWGIVGVRLIPGRELPTTFRAFASEPLFACGMGPGCRMLRTGSEAGPLIADAATGDDAITLTGLGQPIALSADGRRIAHTRVETAAASALERDDQHGARIVNATNGSEIGTVRTKYPVDALAFSHDGTMLAVVEGRYDAKRDYGTRVHVIDVATGRELRVIQADKDGVGAIAFSPDGRRLVIGGANHRADLRVRGTGGSDVTVVELADGGLVARLHGHRDSVTAVAFSADGNRVLSTSRDGTTRLWRLDTGYALTLVTLGTDWLIHDDEGLFDASRRGDKLVAAVQGNRAFAIHQLAARNNRPDLLLERAGIGRPDVIAHFRHRHLQRLAKLGLQANEDLAATFDAAPSVEITELTRDGTTATIAAEISSPAADLTHYQVWIDGVPALPGRGTPVGGRRQQIITRVELGTGTNLIELSASATNGTESLRASREIQIEGTPARELYFLGFGVSRYRDPNLNLGYPEKDARDLATLFERAHKTYRRVHTKLVVDEEVTTDNIRRAKDFLRAATIDDTVIVFLAGHGTYTDDRDAEYLFITHDADLEHLRETAAPFELIENLVAELPARRRLLLLDTCESGDREGGSAPATAGTGALRSRTTRALVRTSADSRGAPPRAVVRDRERFIYADLTRRTGAIVFSSSHGTELSYESDDWQNGAFTAELKVALTDPTSDRDGDGVVSIDELRVTVSAAVARRTRDLQHPTVDRDNPALLLSLPLLHR